PIKDGWEIKPISNLSFFEQCHDFQSMCRRFGSAENFLQYGKGYALCEGTRIVAEIYTAYCGANEVDLSIFTHPDYRRQGAGAQIASFFAEQCVKEGLTPIWGCFTHNQASLMTALSIGFCIKEYYVMLVKREMK
ncbi:MAG: hypothetical protein K0R02_420, partial [Rickettsiaceae bacterium]|nr:hypothetical protein [Rickettsiaceae bacterium]